MSIIIEFEEVNILFSGRKIYTDNLNFKINEGDKFAISGKSGTGKSTALNLIMGFNNQDEGGIRIFENPISPSAVFAFRSKCVWVPQSFNFLKGLTVMETILLPFSFKRNIQLKPDRKKIESYIVRTGLNPELLQTLINDLSGGERQRIASVIALLLEREVLILDEPTSNLDTATAKMLINLLFDSGKTLIISTHDDNVLQHCNNILELK